MTALAQACRMRYESTRECQLMVRRWWAGSCPEACATVAASQRRGREQAAPSGGAEHRRACSQDSPLQHCRPRLVTLPLSAQPLSAPPMRTIRSTGLPSRSLDATPRKSGRDMLSNRSKQTASRQVHSSSSRWGGAPVAVSSGASALTDTRRSYAGSRRSAAALIKKGFPQSRTPARQSPGQTKDCN